MKKLLLLAFLCVATVSVQAQKAATDDQKALKKEMLEKYDTNKDGKLSKEEKGKMSADDKKKWDKAFPHKKKKTTDTGDTSKTAPTDPSKPAATDTK